LVNEPITVKRLSLEQAAVNNTKRRSGKRLRTRIKTGAFYLEAANVGIISGHPLERPIDIALTDEALTFVHIIYMRPRLIIFIVAVCLLPSCEKDEKALVLPPPTGASHASVDMGWNGIIYERQIFFDFDTDTVVFTSDWTSWDLAFEASPDGRHVFMNGGNGVFVYNMHTQDMQQVTELPAHITSTSWQLDASCGLPDSTGIGEWCGAGGTTKGEVYIVQAPQGTYQKMRILALDASGYTIEWAPLEDKGTPATVHLAKDPAYNYVYFSFAKGIVNPEPPKNTWDVVFTRYRPLIYDNTTKQYIPYSVTGVLLNPYNTRGFSRQQNAF
jgi:hypothetical protein